MAYYDPLYAPRGGSRREEEARLIPGLLWEAAAVACALALFVGMRKHRLNAGAGCGDRPFPASWASGGSTWINR